MSTDPQRLPALIKFSLATSQPVITLFAIPKSFEDPHTAMIQRNAIVSWTKLGQSVTIVLVGDEYGVAEIAREFGLQHFITLKKNSHGTPLLNDAFAKAETVNESPLIAYVNADIILLAEFVSVASFLASSMEKFLMIGRRIDLDVHSSINFGEPDWGNRLAEMANSSGALAAVVCKDYFVYPRGQYPTIPSFAVGRGNWDNWLVASTKKAKYPIIDATIAITAIHQNHGYKHVKGGRVAAYVTGIEARENQKLAGGRNLISGCHADMQIETDGDKLKLIPRKSMPFWSDLPSFLSLVKRLVLKK